MYAIKRDTLHSAPVLFMFPLQKQIQRETKKRSVTKTAPWHCFQVQKMRVSKTEIPKRLEIIREAPLWELRQDNRFHSLHFPGEVSAAPANECEQLGQEPRTRSEQEALHPAGDMEG